MLVELMDQLNMVLLSSKMLSKSSKNKTILNGLTVGKENMETPELCPNPLRTIMEDGKLMKTEFYLCGLMRLSKFIMMTIQWLMRLKSKEEPIDGYDVMVE